MKKVKSLVKTKPKRIRVIQFNTGQRLITFGNDFFIDWSGCPTLFGNGDFLVKYGDQNIRHLSPNDVENSVPLLTWTTFEV